MNERIRDINVLINYGVDIEKCLELFGTIEKYDFTITAFFQTIEKNATDLKSYKEIADMAKYAVVVHSIKSEARYFGFEKLADLSYKHELAAKENDMYFVYNNFDELMNELVGVVTTVGKYLEKETTIKENLVVSEKEQSILVVDDSDVIRSFIFSIFNDRFEILSASDGGEALNIIEENKDKKIVGMLLDLEMPNVDGFYVLDILKEQDLFKKIPVCIITGNGIEEIDEYVRNYPIIDILKKPFNEKDVKEKVERFIYSNR
jgi:FOG: CheY-like receiver